MRTFFGDAGSPEALRRSMQVTAVGASAARDDLVALVDDYLETGGPFPERLHVIALSADLTTDLLGRIAELFEEADAEVASWSSTENLGMTQATRARLGSVAQRATKARAT